MRPTRSSTPIRSERRRERRVTSREPESFSGTWTRRPSVVIMTATELRSRPLNRPTGLASTQRAHRSPRPGVAAVYGLRNDRATQCTVLDRTRQGYGSACVCRVTRARILRRNAVVRSGLGSVPAAYQCLCWKTSRVGSQPAPCGSERQASGPPCTNRPPIRARGPRWAGSDLSLSTITRSSDRGSNRGAGWLSPAPKCGMAERHGEREGGRHGGPHGGPHGQPAARIPGDPPLAGPDHR